MDLSRILQKAVWLGGSFALLAGGRVLALSTGIPATLTIDPATVRDHGRNPIPLVATVILEGPSPSFFVCELRSADARKLSFASIIFRKGDVQGQGKGFVNWALVRKDSRIRVTAYSVDAPDRQLSFTVTLKPKPSGEAPSGTAESQ